MTSGSDKGPEPAVGQLWICAGATYWITFINDDVVHLEGENALITASPYDRKDFEIGRETGEWKFVKYAEEICHRCNENLQMDDDYLCEACRFG